MMVYYLMHQDSVKKVYPLDYQPDVKADAMRVSNIKAPNNQVLITQVANIESSVQPYDGWGINTINHSLLQQNNYLLMAITSNNDDLLVVGYCLYQALFEQAEILRIGTAPKMQRQGIASRLLNMVISELKQKQVENLLLEVRADNHAAIGLYQNFSFKPIHQRKGYYQVPNHAPIDALIMQRHL